MRREVLSGVSGAAVVAAFLVLPLFYQNESVLFQAMVYLVLAQGVNILYGFTGYLPFGYVGFFGIGAYGASLAMLHLHLPPAAAAAAGGFSAVLLGLLLTPLLRLSGAYFAIASLAASQMVYYIVSNPNLTPWTNGPYGLDLEGFFNAGASYGAMVVLLAAVTAFVVMLRHSRYGLSLQAIREDAVSAGMAGIHVLRGRVSAWLASAFVAGAAGALFAWHISVFYPSTVFNLNTSIFAIVFTLFGGGATLLGPVVGTAILYGLYTAIGVSEPQYFQLIYGLVIVFLALFLPDGLVSLARRRGIHVP